ncbi:MAG: aminomethyl-transferring glycine dehydrogenase [Algisphaera sp.]
MSSSITATSQTDSAVSSDAALDTFARRHHGQVAGDLEAMLAVTGAADLDALMGQTVPADICLEKLLTLEALPGALSESEALKRLESYAKQNHPEIKSLIGQGYYGTKTPAVILRNVLENPAWYTPYTPYQAEISQGRLEALLNFQTVIADLTGLPLAGASLLDEGTAAAEAMAMCLAASRGKTPRFFVAHDVHPQTLEVMRTRADSMGIELVVEALDAFEKSPEGFCGVLVQTPTTKGDVHSPEDLARLAEVAHEAGALVVAATDLLACCLMQPPGVWGADIAVGSSQRFGVPMGYGGPHAAFVATHEKHARKMPGRLIGLSKDVHGNPAYRMAIQTREQHIKRDKATSNICTSQVLLAIAAGFYATYHGAEGLRAIARRVHRRARRLAAAVVEGGLALANTARFFDTVSVQYDTAHDADAAMRRALGAGYNLRLIDGHVVNVALDETVTGDDLKVLAEALTGRPPRSASGHLDNAPLSDLFAQAPFARTTEFLHHATFCKYRTEHAFLRYTSRLISKDYSLMHGMIPLGSCTMKLNAAAEMLPITWPGFAHLHPFAPADQAAGYRRLFDELESWFAAITGFAAVSLQPNAGSQGEYAGLLAIRAYHRSRGDAQRTVCLIPTSAHGTNPASAVIAGMTVVAVKCRDNGDIDLEDLMAKAKTHADTLAALMVTYPSTHGVFESDIRAVCQVVHDHGGQVYMDGANMNAQVGLTSPGHMGADVCHLNLHKTFCIPHGGGGPGVGPIGVAAHLAAFLPSVDLAMTEGEASPCRVSAAGYGSPMVLPISWMYIAMMGAEGLTQASRRAILNANYMAGRLREHYRILYSGKAGHVAHEFILDCRPFEKSAGVTIEDFAKRLIDYGFHAPTMSWPVAGTLMIEPTESETKAELDRFCDAMIAIRDEIREIEEGRWPREDHPMCHAPHTAAAVVADEWSHAYSRHQAVFPAVGQDQDGHKFWPSVGRIDNPYGDRNLVCSCPPMES